MATKKKTAAKRHTVELKFDKELFASPNLLAEAFDEWMKRYIENPAAFAAEFQSVASFKSKRKGKGASDYGNSCASYLVSVMRDVALARANRAVRTRVVRK